MAHRSKSLKELFLSALEVALAERAVWLDGPCARDSGLRRQLGGIPAAHEAPHSRLDQTAMVDPATGDEPLSGQSVSMHPGIQVGPYKLREQSDIGHTGRIVGRTIALHLLRDQVPLHWLDAKVLCKLHQKTGPEKKREFAAFLTHRSNRRSSGKWAPTFHLRGNKPR